MPHGISYRYRPRAPSKLMTAEWQPGEEDLDGGGWTRAALLKMNERFVARVERAFENGTEHHHRPQR